MVTLLEDMSFVPIKSSFSNNSVKMTGSQVDKNLDRSIFLSPTFPFLNWKVVFLSFIPISPLFTTMTVRKNGDFLKSNRPFLKGRKKGNFGRQAERREDEGPFHLGYCPFSKVGKAIHWFSQQPWHQANFETNVPKCGKCAQTKWLKGNKQSDQSENITRPSINFSS